MPQAPKEITETATDGTTAGSHGLLSLSKLPALTVGTAGKRVEHHPLAS